MDTRKIGALGLAGLFILLVEVGMVSGFHRWVWQPETVSLPMLCMVAGAGVVLLQGRWVIWAVQMAATTKSSTEPSGWKAGLGQLIELLVFVGLFGLYGQLGSWSGLSETAVLLGLSSMAVIGHGVVAELLGIVLPVSAHQHPSRQFDRLQDWLRQQTQKLGMEPVKLELLEGDAEIAGARNGPVSPPTILLRRGVLQHMSFQELQALCAHELGHLYGGDPGKRQKSWLLYAGANFIMVLALGHFLTFEPPVSTLLGPLTLSLGAILALGVAWKLQLNKLSQQWEYRADRMAIRLLGEGEVLGELLERLGADKKPSGSLWKRHPPTSQRVERLRSPPKMPGPAGLPQKPRKSSIR